MSFKGGFQGSGGGGGSLTLAQVLANGNAAGSKKITGLTNGSAAQDAAAFGQIPTSFYQITGITTADAELANDVTMTNANQFYDGPSVLLAAGTWLMTWKIAILTAGATQSESYTGKLWDGTTVYDESEMGNSSIATGYIITVSGFAIVVLASPDTLKISAASGRGSQVMKRDVPDNSASTHTATRLSGIRVA